jgi:aminoglycoside phosphotransferase (APT) family kinase protein
MRRLALKLANHYFPRKKISISRLGGGLTNYVFSLRAGREELVLRISDDPGKIDFFLREQWAIDKARPLKIPVPDILEVGNTVIPFPYMLSKKTEGVMALGHPERKEILFELGKLAALVHEIPTEGYGRQFNWSVNELDRTRSWKKFLEDELQTSHRIHILERNRMLSPASLQKLRVQVKKITSWKAKPSLHHGDLRLKNVMVNEKGKIQAILDWEDCISAIGPAWDISIAIHDLPIDGQQRFLEGYGLSGRQLINLSPSLATFNLLNYATVIEKLQQKKQKHRLAYYRARMHGAMDLFSL